MQDINRVCLSGNLTRDPEIKSAQSGTQILSFGIAVNDRRKNSQTGEWGDYPNFIDCVMFGTRAESVSRFISKGSRVTIEGKLHYNSWTTDSGDKRSKLEVVVDNVVFMQKAQQATSSTAPKRPQQVARDEIYDESVPF